MKDYAHILETSRRASIQKVVPLKSDKAGLSQWNALQLIEDTAAKLRSRLDAILPKELQETVTNVNLEIFNDPEKGLQLFIKGQFYGVTKKELLLKVFVHQINSKGKSIRVAKAVYQIALERDFRAA